MSGPGVDARDMDARAWEVLDMGTDAGPGVVARMEDGLGPKMFTYNEECILSWASSVLKMFRLILKLLKAKSRLSKPRPYKCPSPLSTISLKHAVTFLRTMLKSPTVMWPSTFTGALEKSAARFMMFFKANFVNLALPAGAAKGRLDSCQCGILEGVGGWE